MQAHDELAVLFSRNLTFNPEIQNQEVPRQVDPAVTPVSPQNIVYSISQHYHHSAHIPRTSDQSEGLTHEETERGSPEPPQGESMSSENVLRIHGIDPATLTPSQIQLFRIADLPQQRRLLELWSIGPPNNGGDIPALAWSSTTLEQEEQLARIRLERLQQEQAMTLDGIQVQAQNRQWPTHSTAESEPYMISGYEELMRRERERQAAASGSVNCGGHTYTPATDPVYLGPDYSREQQQMDMTSQCGAFEQFRGSAHMDAMDVM